MSDWVGLVGEPGWRQRGEVWWRGGDKITEWMSVVERQRERKRWRDRKIKWRRRREESPTQTQTHTHTPTTTHKPTLTHTHTETLTHTDTPAHTHRHTHDTHTHTDTHTHIHTLLNPSIPPSVRTDGLPPPQLLIGLQLLTSCVYCTPPHTSRPPAGPAVRRGRRPDAVDTRWGFSAAGATNVFPWRQASEPD